MLKYHFSLMYNSQNSERPDLGEQNGTLFSRLCRRADVSRFDLIRNMRVTPGLDGWARTIPSPAGDSRLRRARPRVLDEWNEFQRRATPSTLNYTERFRGFGLTIILGAQFYVAVWPDLRAGRHFDGQRVAPS